MTNRAFRCPAALLLAEETGPVRHIQVFDGTTALDGSNTQVFALYNAACEDFSALHISDPNGFVVITALRVRAGNIMTTPM